MVTAKKINATQNTKEFNQKGKNSMKAAKSLTHSGSINHSSIVSNAVRNYAAQKQKKGIEKIMSMLENANVNTSEIAPELYAKLLEAAKAELRAEMEAEKASRAGKRGRPSNVSDDAFIAAHLAAVEANEGPEGVMTRLPDVFKGKTLEQAKSYISVKASAIRNKGIQLPEFTRGRKPQLRVVESPEQTADQAASQLAEVIEQIAPDATPEVVEAIADAALTAVEATEETPVLAEPEAIAAGPAKSAKAKKKKK